MKANVLREWMQSLFEKHSTKPKASSPNPKIKGERQLFTRLDNNFSPVPQQSAPLSLLDQLYASASQQTKEGKSQEVSVGKSAGARPVRVTRTRRPAYTEEQEDIEALKQSTFKYSVVHGLGKRWER
jgi:hypothetical protein